MKLVQVINKFGLQSGGAERLAYDLHLDLLGSGIDAHILALEACETGGIANAASLGFQTPYHPLVPFRLTRYLKATHPDADLIHGHLFPTSAHLALLKRLGLLRRPLVFTEHNTSNRRRGMVTGKAIDKAVYGAFEQIFCISDGTRDALVKAFPNLSERASVIENGASLRFSEFPDRTRSKPVKLLSVGRLNRQKNYPRILEALSRLPKGSAEYTVLGKGADRAALEGQARELAIPVHFGGHVTDPTPYFAKADIFLIPSVWEGFGLAAVEAMNAGLPVIASNVAGLREVTGRDGSCAIIVEHDDVDAIFAAVEKLINEPATCDEMGRKGFLRAQLFDKSAMTQKYIAAYQSLVSS